MVSSQTSNTPKTYSTELWFKTTTTTGGRLIGFGNASTGSSSTSDRQVCCSTTAGCSSANPGTRTLAETTTSYNDRQWHHVVATQGADGMKLYVDGIQVATNAATDAASYTGYWRVGGDRYYGGTRRATTSRPRSTRPRSTRPPYR